MHARMPREPLAADSENYPTSIGRITEGLLLDVAKQVDVVEPIAKFTEKLASLPNVSVTNIGLEEWVPPSSSAVSEGQGYDLIWNQWCVGHLTDEQLVAYLQRCQGALAEGGVIVVKENLSTSGVDLFDEVDSSVTRYVLSLVEEGSEALLCEELLQLPPP